ncbi:MAG TPA: PilZ domain-containing protein [Burkholderiaceae bacterium]|nr:PilZ domain-containing protein [Burkholderiaceae bacterium]
MAERRENNRIPVGVDVVLNYREHALICTLRDISLNGAFLEAPPDDLPYTNSSGELALTVTKGGQSKHCRIPARISRITDNGAAVSFSDVGLDAYSSLVSIVYEA